MHVAKHNNFDISQLEHLVEQLLTKLDQVSDENHALKAQQQNLIAERAALIEKSELARSRVESMLERLRAMESSR